MDELRKDYLSTSKIEQEETNKVKNVAGIVQRYEFTY